MGSARPDPLRNVSSGSGTAGGGPGRVPGAGLCSKMKNVFRVEEAACGPRPSVVVYLVDARGEHLRRSSCIRGRETREVHAEPAAGGKAGEEPDDRRRGCIVVRGIRRRPSKEVVSFPRATSTGPAGEGVQILQNTTSGVYHYVRTLAGSRGGLSERG